MKNQLPISSRIILVLCAIALTFVLFTPIWRIELNAPQYPEGLMLTIHAKGLKGNVDIINGLNHYIGMKSLHNEDFIEFTLLPFVIIFFVLTFILVALINRRKLFYFLLFLFISFGIIAMTDFWKWEYNYGHNLNPNAAIVVPGMAYQPPLIGFKQLLNFGAYSIPDTGGWIFISVGVLLLVILISDWRKNKKGSSVKFVMFVFAIPFFFESCNSSPEKIIIGKDHCAFCKMTIADASYGGELITGKGKVYKFDDIHCILSFIKEENKNAASAKIYLADYCGTHDLITADSSFLIEGGLVHAPMNGKYIAFSNSDSANKYSEDMNAQPADWNALSK